MYADDVLAPWAEQTRGMLPPVELFDAHTHIGVDDPDGFKCTAEQLLAVLAPSRSRAVVFPMHEPAGYPPANDHVIATALQSGGVLVPFCRLDPSADPVVEVHRCVDAGARGIKLHPRAEQFGMLDHGVREIVQVAHERRLPILIHAGRGIPALGSHVLDYAGEFPNARFILAHAGVCDLAWIWRRVADYPNVFFDTAWWSPTDQLALFSLVPPGQILYATDIPFGTPPQTLISVFRVALQAGLSAEQIAAVASGQLERIVAGEETLDLGPPVAPSGTRSDPLLARVTYFLTCAFATAISGGDPFELLDLARLACKVGDDAPQAVHCAAVSELIAHALEQPLGDTIPERLAHVHVVITAATIASTPDVPVMSQGPRDAITAR
ncbi:MAG TPA: amidohydrolase family protein [Solirubrobacteraceae bacterium]|nr:amidohydrolase family protein [Solirubrobacteraceae bacterium]